MAAKKSTDMFSSQTKIVFGLGMTAGIIVQSIIPVFQIMAFLISGIAKSLS